MYLKRHTDYHFIENRGSRLVITCSKVIALFMVYLRYLSLTIRRAMLLEHIIVPPPFFVTSIKKEYPGTYHSRLLFQISFLSWGRIKFPGIGWLNFDFDLSSKNHSTRGSRIDAWNPPLRIFIPNSIETSLHNEPMSFRRLVGWFVCHKRVSSSFFFLKTDYVYRWLADINKFGHTD